VPISLKYLIKGQMRFMTKNGYDVTMISSDGYEIDDIVKNEKCRHLIFPLTRKITPFKDLEVTYKLYKYLKKEKPEIVHTHTPKAGVVGMLAAYLARVPIRLHTVAGLPLLEANGIKRKVLNFAEKLTYKCSTKVYPNSFGLKKIIKENKFIKADKLKVIANGSSNGIDTSYFNSDLFSDSKKITLKEDLKIQKEDFVFIFVGRIVGDKGINELIEAFAELSKKKNHVKLLLVGPLEEELDPLERKTKEVIKTNKQIISIGFQNDVRPYFAISDVLVFPSYREGFPNVVLQAGSMSLPSIVSDINGCNEIIENNLNGILIKAKSISAIYDAMFEICTNYTLFNELKEKTRNIIKQRYERKLFWDLLLSEYNSLIKNEK
tara:strand:+ start:379 stop:1512 length:1134 start_codon:yes stop_codon:yes gene_type:complete